MGSDFLTYMKIPNEEKNTREEDSPTIIGDDNEEEIFIDC